jgi:hypothetical protein
MVIYKKRVYDGLIKGYKYDQLRNVVWLEGLFLVKFAGFHEYYHDIIR